MPKMRKALLHYLTVAETKFTKLTLSNNKEVILSLKSERFPHLAGVQYIPKYKKIPALSMVNQILSKDILSDELINKLPRKEKSFVIDKIKAITGDFNFGKMKVLMDENNKQLQLNKNIYGDLITVNYNKSKTKQFATIYNRDTYGIYHPKSTLFISKNTPKSKIIESFKVLTTTKVENLRSLKGTK